MKRRMQNVKFGNVAELLAFLPEDQLQITEQLRSIILETIPHATEKLSYNVPYYKLRKNVCFIWPGAVPWGKTIKEGVMLGFTYGYLLHDEGHYLERGERQQVFAKTYREPEAIEAEIIRHFLLESAEVDEMLYLEKLQKRKR